MGEELISSDKFTWNAPWQPARVAYYDIGQDDVKVSKSTEAKLRSSFSDAYEKYMQITSEPLRWNSGKPSDKIPKSIKPKRGLTMDQKMRNAEVRYNLKDEYTLKECLDAFNDLCNKEIGDIYLTGSVALYLQGRITRTMFKDLDVICVGEYMLDDDIYDNPYGCKYPPDPSGVERKPLAFNNVKIDLFSNINFVNIVDIEYFGKMYKCQDYKDIIKAKLRMVLPKVKDLDELLETSFEITYK
jgi:hypothetical protein